MAEIGQYRLDVLANLAATVSSRRGASPETSYTAKLLAQGVEKCAKKLGEEAVEAALAAVKGDRSNLTKESADLLYHLLVLLEAAEVPIADVMAELERRSGTGGLAEKASRKVP
jgi:phosphoribosyl-ATP pyrophosphohydrolase